MSDVTISKSNDKMGAIHSISLPAGVTCRKDAPCYALCYAQRLSRRRARVRKSYERNLRTLQEKPELYWKTVELEFMTQRIFRWHVSGDIPNVDYLSHMVDLAVRYPTCQSVCFTKRFDFVNTWIKEHGDLPSNLHVIFSGWKGLKMDNPYSLPECHVIFKDGYIGAKDGAKYCGGNCFECFCTGTGCWTLQKGEQVLIKQH